MHPMPSPLIALVNATTAAVAPASAAVRAEIPDATVWSILDDRLLQDAEAAGGIDDRLLARMRRLLEHAAADRADQRLPIILRFELDHGLRAIVQGCRRYELKGQGDLPGRSPGILDMAPRASPHSPIHHWLRQVLTRNRLPGDAPSGS